MKTLWIVLAVIFGLIIIVTVAGLIYLGPIVKVGIERFGPQITKVPVKVDGVNISVLSGSATITGLIVGNPPGYNNPNAIEMGTMSISLDPFSVTSNKIIIHSVHVESPVITFEGGLSGNNLSKLLKNVNSSAQNPNAPGNGNVQSSTGKPAPKIEIDDFLITGAKVNIGISGVGSKLLPLPEIHLTNLGKDSNGLTPIELTRTILKTIITSTLNLVASSLGDIKGTLTGLTGSLTNSFGNIFGK